MIDGQRNGLVGDGLLNKSLPLEHLPALLDADLNGVADLRAFGLIAPILFFPTAIELADQLQVILEVDRRILRDPRRCDEGIRCHEQELSSTAPCKTTTRTKCLFVAGEVAFVGRQIGRIRLD